MYYRCVFHQALVMSSFVVEKNIQIYYRSQKSEHQFIFQIFFLRYSYANLFLHRLKIFVLCLFILQSPSKFHSMVVYYKHLHSMPAVIETSKLKVNEDFFNDKTYRKKNVIKIISFIIHLKYQLSFSSSSMHFAILHLQTGIFSDNSKDVQGLKNLKIESYIVLAWMKSFVRTWKSYSLWGSILLVVLVSSYTGLHNVFNERGNRLKQLQQIQVCQWISQLKS